MAVTGLASFDAGCVSVAIEREWQSRQSRCAAPRHGTWQARHPSANLEWAEPNMPGIKKLLSAPPNALKRAVVISRAVTVMVIAGLFMD